MKNKVNLFLIGAPKCGTSYLAKQLSLNSEIFVPRIKELNFFSSKYLKNQNSYYQYYETSSILKYENNYPLFNNKFKYFVDSSVSYFTFPEVFQNISEYNGDAKFIILYRNPLERAISHYKMDLRMGAVDKEFVDLISDSSLYSYRQYIDNSLFYKWSTMLIEKFGKDNVLIVNLEYLDSETLSDFLDIKINFYDIGKVNSAQSSKNFIGAYFLKNRNFSSKLKKYIPFFVINHVKKLFYSKKDLKIQISDCEKKMFWSVVQDDWNKFRNLYS